MLTHRGRPVKPTGVRRVCSGQAPGTPLDPWLELGISWRSPDPTRWGRGSTGRARPGDGAGAAVAEGRCHRRLAMQRHLLVVALASGCLALGFPPTAAARAATVTTTSGSSAAVPATPASPATPTPTAPATTPTFPTIWGAPPAPGAPGAAGG